MTDYLVPPRLTRGRLGPSHFYVEIQRSSVLLTLSRRVDRKSSELRVSYGVFLEGKRHEGRKWVRKEKEKIDCTCHSGWHTVGPREAKPSQPCLSFQGLSQNGRAS